MESLFLDLAQQAASLSLIVIGAFAYGWGRGKHDERETHKQNLESIVQYYEKLNEIPEPEPSPFTSDPNPLKKDLTIQELPVAEESSSEEQ
jgi:hypothetical protein